MVYVEVDDSVSLASFRAEMFPCCFDAVAAAAYLDKLVEHVRWVRKAGRKLGVRQFLLDVHDQSKFLFVEFPAAVERFHRGNPYPDWYAHAWLHHIHHNPHHWQHWMFSDGFTPKGSSVEAGVMEMPRDYALEMVADWMGSSMTYTGSWDMAKWLTENAGRIRLHTKTAAYVCEVLDSLGYADVIFAQPWAHEAQPKAKEV